MPVWMANHPNIRPILPDNSPSINSFKSSFMALLPILRYPDPRLHKKSAPVIEVNARIRRLVYGCQNPKAGAVRTLYRIVEDPRLNHRVEVLDGVLADECAIMLRSFFSALRRAS